VNYALGFSKTREYKECSELKEAINLVEEHLHKKYYLINCLKKGVALITSIFCSDFQSFSSTFMQIILPDISFVILPALPAR
jgi:hypothetical protein